jgi:hypothetical protein
VAGLKAKVLERIETLEECQWITLMVARSFTSPGRRFPLRAARFLRENPPAPYELGVGG